jgi:BirA family biotin operon repressor/biotin-[acetyl-CoA-carboxylase] ligase
MLVSVFDTTSAWAEERGLFTQLLTETGSTQDIAKSRALNESESIALYLTSHQTAGRGRGTNTWLDTGAGEALLSSWSLEVASAPQAITGPRVGLAVFNAAKSTWPSLAWSLKAPNDLYLDGQKVAGLLTEAISSGSKHRLIIGLGMNVLNHPRTFQNATHLSAPLNASPDEGDWYQFLDELRGQITSSLREVTLPALSPIACDQLLLALNANPSKAFEVLSVSPQGDLIHASGTVRWESI